VRVNSIEGEFWPPHSLSREGVGPPPKSWPPPSRGGFRALHCTQCPVPRSSLPVLPLSISPPLSVSHCFYPLSIFPPLPVPTLSTSLFHSQSTCSFPSFFTALPPLLLISDELEGSLPSPAWRGVRKGSKWWGRTLRRQNRKQASKWQIHHKGCCSESPKKYFWQRP